MLRTAPRDEHIHFGPEEPVKAEVPRTQLIIEWSPWSSAAQTGSRGQQVERAHRLVLAQLNLRVLDELIPVGALPPKHRGERLRAEAPHIVIKVMRACCSHAEKRLAAGHCVDECDAAVRLPSPCWLPFCTSYAAGCEALYSGTGEAERVCLS